MTDVHGLYTQLKTGQEELAATNAQLEEVKGKLAELEGAAEEKSGQASSLEEQLKESLGKVIKHRQDQLRKANAAYKLGKFDLAMMYIDGVEEPEDCLPIEVKQVDLRTLEGLDISRQNEVWTHQTDFDVRLITEDTARVYLAGRSAIKALDLQSGEIVWQAKASERDHNQILDMDMSAGHLVVANRLGGTVALAPESGSERWRSADKDQAMFACVEGSSAYTLTKEGLHALSCENGKVLWTRSPSGSSPILASGDQIFTIEYQDRSPFALALDANGEEMWKTSHMNSTCLAVDRDRVYAGTGNKIIALSREDGQPIWESEAGREGSPVSIGAGEGKLFSLVDQHHHRQHRFYLKQIDPESGERLWCREVHANICSPRITSVQKGNVLVESREYSGYLFDAENGNRK